MKKIVFLSLFALCLPWTLVAQSIDDDLYYTPSKNKEEKKEEVKQEKKVAAPVEEIVVKSNVPTTVYSSPGSTTVVVKDRKGNTRDVDEYNRRYDSRDNDFVMENDTLYINEKEDDGLDGEWVNGEFEGSQDDYEYATRIIRFRNPRYAISISSPLYWDVVYGLNSWDWNVYTDGLYAYLGRLSLLWLGMEQLVRSELELWLGRLVRRWLVGTSSSPSLSSRILSRWRWSLGRWPLGKCIYQ